MLQDQNARHQATDPRQSFIVQAPAGSGKTELLTQRFLRLLAVVDAPEQIVALTFTRKAANEMRERILKALSMAKNQVQVDSEHLKQTLGYAQEALQQDERKNWQLLNLPGRLHILTIDSLCQRLNQAIPLQEKQIAYASVCEKPQQYYRQAAEDCFHYALNESAFQLSLKQLLHHVDNQQEKLLDFFGELLAKRDHWIGMVSTARSLTKDAFEAALAWIEQHEINLLHQTLPADIAAELVDLARHMADVEKDPNSPRYELRTWHSFKALDRPLSKSLAALLLTSQKTLRKSFDHHVGLKRGNCADNEYTSLKERSKALLLTLGDYPEFQEALLQVKDLPAPHYEEQQWQTLQALFTLLPLLAASLQVVFSQANTVDFTAISHQALNALGDEDSPTDLTLYLDYQIHHLLVDEFQDTSIQQFQLLSKIVGGWEAHDAKTMFLVGDPMQSIYRFRAAEVGLFLRAKEQGIGPVSLTPLQLSSNFRSTASIVNWVNAQFNIIFPQSNDIESGAVSYHASTGIHPESEDSFIKAVAFTDANHEACALVQQVQWELNQYPKDTIAILVRTRNQLTQIMQLLRQLQIPFQGVEVDPLAGLLHLRDTWSLTKALLHPANRLAWLCVLRSPFCGLSLQDLLLIANYDKKQSVYFALMNLSEIKGLSPEGHRRAHFVASILHQALLLRQQQPLAEWIRTTLTRLHGEHVFGQDKYQDLEQFFCLLEEYEDSGQITDEKRFKKDLKNLYAKQSTPSRLQVMTIHKSKGLEFDSVFLPGLSAKPANQDRPLLRWLKLPTEHQDLLLVSPIKASTQEHCLLYDYLGRLDLQKDNFEQQRLFYVAATRAKKRLYLYDNHEKGGPHSFRYFLKEQEFSIEDQSELQDTPQHLPELYALPDHYYQHPLATPTTVGNLSALAIDNGDKRLGGIVMHELLHLICDRHLTDLTTIPWQFVKSRLVAQGLTSERLETALNEYQAMLARFYQDPTGQWIIAPHHHEHNEYELLIDDNGRVLTRIIDRTFIDDQGICWIIDFKTGQDHAAERQKHQEQLKEYATIISKRLPNPVQCGLYYLATNQWFSWEHAPPS